jgi:hypothetical protein
MKSDWTLIEKGLVLCQFCSTTTTTTKKNHQMSAGQGNNSQLWNPWDTTAVTTAPAQAAGPATTGQSEMFFDPFGSFATEAPAPVVVAQPTAPVVVQAPVAVAPTAMVTQNDPFGALTNPLPISSATPEPTMTTMAFSSDFMDLLAGPQSGSGSSNDTQLSGVTTALDDFFGSPAPQVATSSNASPSSAPSAASSTPSATSNVASSVSTSSTTDTESKDVAASSSKSSAPKREGPKAMTAEEKDREDEVLRSFELKGNLEKLSQGLLGESWKPKWVTFKTNRFAYYEQKTDPRPKYYVYLDECDVGLPKNMTQSYDFNHSFQLVNERKATTWYFRTGGVADLKKWTQAFAASIAHYKDRNVETTIYERLLALACVRYRSVEQYRSFHFYTSKQSTGSYAIAACILIELLIRRCIDITSHENVILHADVRYQGIGVLDDTLDLLSQKLRMQREFRLAEFIPMLLCSSAFVFGDLSLDAPVLRCIDSSVKRGTLKKGQTPKDWHVSNLTLEDDLLKTFHSLTKAPYNGTDVREHATLGICYTIMRALNKTETPVQDVLDRGKVFPDLQTRTQVDAALDAMAKNLGPFERKHTLVLKAIFTQLVQFISGAGQYPSTQGR